MSISSMTNVAFARRRDVPPTGEAPGSIGAIAGEKGDREETQTQASTTLSAIAAYIPTELLTIYVAVVAALNATTTDAAPNPSAWPALIIFVIVTPVVVWLVYAGKVRKAKKTLPLSIGQWPKWEMMAATIAFAAWAFAFPQTPFADFSWYNAAIAGLVVLIVTTGLGLLAPVIGTLEP